MGKVYSTQTVLKFIVSTHVDITGATKLRIKYEKPTGVQGEWTAVEEGDPLLGEIAYEIIAELGAFDNWKFWAWIEFSAGMFAPGVPKTIRIYEEGK